MNILDIENLSKSYGSAAALRGAGFAVPPGKIIGLLGPNGSGKTTLIKILAGLITDYSGSALIGGLPPGPETCAVVSYLPDNPVLPGWLTAGEAIRLFEDFYPDFDPALAGNMLQSMGIEPKKRVKTLSKGTREKLQLALVMSRRAKLYVLDEPIAAVDPAARDFIINTILKNFGDGSSLLISTHLIGDIEAILDHVIFLKEGEVVLAEEAEGLRERTGSSVDQLFREVFRC